MAVHTFLRKLVSWELWIVTGLVALSFLVERLLPWVVMIMGCFWLLRWLVYHRFSLRTPSDWPILGMFLMALVTLWITALPQVTQPQVFRLLAGMGLYYAFANYPSVWSNAADCQARLRCLFIGLALAALALGVFSFVSVDWSTGGKLPFIPPSLYAVFPSLVSDTANPNVMGGSLMLLLVVIAGALFFGWRAFCWTERLLFGMALLLGSGVLLLSQSRGSLLALGFSLLLLILMRWRWGWLMVFIATTGLVVFLSTIGPMPLNNFLISSATLGGWDGRLEIWSRAIYMLQDFPFTGVGMGSYGWVADLLYPFFLYSPGKVFHAHNLLLQVAVDLGIPGLVCWLATWMLISLVAWQVHRRGRQMANGWLSAFGAGLFSCQMALMVHGMLDAVTWGMVRPAPIVWALWGLTVAAWYTVFPDKFLQEKAG